MRKLLRAIIQESEGACVVECLELPIVSQGAGLDEAVSNFREAVSVHLEADDFSGLGLSPNPDSQ
ncbi:MAG TPA: hypothetical protein VN661_10115 [Candidatus Acidoferrales bacterium]|nr:hypothetical protein [Candidatus Acidoferrales bacterium]